MSGRPDIPEHPRPTAPTGSTTSCGTGPGPQATPPSTGRARPRHSPAPGTWTPSTPAPRGSSETTLPGTTVSGTLPAPVSRPDPASRPDPVPPPGRATPLLSGTPPAPRRGHEPVTAPLAPVRGADPDPGFAPSSGVLPLPGTDAPDATSDTTTGDTATGDTATGDTADSAVDDTVDDATAGGGPGGDELVYGDFEDDGLDDEFTERIRARRVRVTLPPPTPDAERRPAPSAATASATPPPDGLGTFDLGSVPASVTPPRTWRRAAWFAALSSTGVIVALLVAGTAFVGRTDEQPRAVEVWPERGGRLAVAPEQGQPGEPGDSAGTTAPPATPAGKDAQGAGTAAEGDSTDRPAGFGAPAREGESGTGLSDAAASGPDGSGDEPGGVAADGDHGEVAGEPAEAQMADGPRKPPVTPAATSTEDEENVGLLRTGHDAETLAQRSQDFFDTVTEDPEAAHALTTGELAEQGPEGLARRYAGVAYFEVRHVHIDTAEGVTVTTLRITRPDGSTTEATRELTFAADDRISAVEG